MSGFRVRAARQANPVKELCSFYIGGRKMGNRIFKWNNLNKTIRYLKKNGIRHAYYAARERIEEERKEAYCYRPPSEEALDRQRRETADLPYLFSIVVPVYETREEFLRAMIDSVRRQSYGGWELLLIDASSSDAVEKIVREIMEEQQDDRMKYWHFRENKGISGNTNVGIERASGDYIALLDHDDLLAPDALYHMVKALQAAKQKGRNPALLYSDEDKLESGSSGQLSYGSPHWKEEFNLDLILSNNYICHFMAVEAGVMKSLQLRGEYDGAQDYDLVLRVVGKLYETGSVQDFMHDIVHVPGILYHWRCHADSTAANTASKSYAYDAGAAALQDFCDSRGWKGKVGHSLHLGFYQIDYLPDILTARPDVGIVGGRILDRSNRICAGAYQEDGTCMYEGLHREYSGGSTHRAALKQDVYAVDIRCMQVRPELWEAFAQITGTAYRERRISCRTKGGGRERQIADVSGLCCDEAGYCKLSLEISRAAAQKGYLVLWDPGLTCPNPR